WAYRSLSLIGDYDNLPTPFGEEPSAQGQVWKIGVDSWALTLHISNALAENAIRPFAVGRRNWLFADTPRGAKASATVYSLIETAKANGLEPFAYIHHVLQHIGGASTVEEIEALLPWNVTLSKLQEG
ncbi:transposase domain-containing protein, partial [Thiolapillus sp.]|uniref:transposase domain-containing protein n=1 Tax=Thiolapillus sp. TaxID=2017437 RepID=UPI003AF578CD